ncbi:MAG: hypothetical protein FJZ47_14215 [Candidatus Tectomicrobia bacterium]|uniref:Uncharacterized protein n=1 Tax=Tectimicrobiota bacterium TaxID=2528274 RepID=A0A938B357_UNCTE|nr:hypothetical protein [Candidatus Tectomicrobia bacterium]
MLEQFLLLLFVVVITLFSVFIERLKARHSQAPPEDAPLVSSVPPHAPTPLPPRVVASRVSLEEPRGAPESPVLPPRGLRPRARMSLGDLHNVRRGIVLMTLLGPCRALEPPPPRPQGETQGG